MLTIQQMMSVTSSDIRRSSRKCSILKFKGYLDVDDKGEELKIAEFYVKGETGRYKTYIVLKGPVKTTTKAWVSCNCPFFLYHCEVALAKRGSSSILYSNGKLPVEKNPRLIPYLCKHLVRSVINLPVVKFEATDKIPASVLQRELARLRERF